MKKKTFAKQFHIIVNINTQYMKFPNLSALSSPR